ncbi:helix-turn-helix transcriptional regulator [Proteiniclasticum sp.]|uniref:helix-turn-helix domain-containing protein n=1 Tax=Proteiniclasticum sp. TaxID=2053595 RepID=UPI0028A1905D|nr:helix-turn-helix transcriptional regulator [Proteiniclasticum sp.]
MKQETIICVIESAIGFHGIKGELIAEQIGISYTYLRQIIQGERGFSQETYEKAVLWYENYISLFN